MSRARVVSFAAVLHLLAAGPSGAFTVEFAGFDPTGDEWVGCGLDLQGTDQLVVVDEPEEPGLAVAGGPSDLLIDGNESVLVRFQDGPATNVRYTVSEIVASGGATIRGYDAALDLIDTVEVSGLGEKDVSALFGGVPLGAFSVTNSVGGHRIASLAFEPPGGVVSINLREAPDEQQESLKHCGIGFASPGLIYVDFSTGIGVHGGSGSPYLIEPGESLTVELPEPVSALGYTPLTTGVGAVRVRLTAFGSTGAVLGETEVQGASPTDVSAQFGGALLTGFDLEVLQGEITLVELVFVPEPGAAAGGLAALATLAVLRPARRRR